MTALLDRLPHRDPFRFLTEVAAIEPGVSARGTWRVRGDEAFFAGHFPGEPIVPGVLLAESMAQLSGLVAFADGKIHAAKLARADVKFLVTVRPPAEIDIESKLVRSLGELYMFEVKASVEKAPVAEGNLVLC